jgi:alkanesulfonate monooxygenase SsuD/methylene tetrahydromethanopterin reductase-like flavin-dependent oxidoreductase (luciferase family)
MWRGETGVGPAPTRRERPGLLIGGTSEVAVRRPAKYADGWTMGGGTPDALADALENLNAVGAPPAARASRARWRSSTS